jgi:hypothetical protein
MFADQLAAAIDGARTDARLVELNHAIMKGLHAQAIGDDDAQRLAELIHARRMAARATGKPVGGFQPVGGIFRPRRPQRAPLRAVAIERRRRLAALGPLPPTLACRFTTGELACLRIIGDEIRAKGACILTIAAIAARAGVSRTTVQNALRQASRLGLVKIEVRRQPRAQNLPNRITIVSKEWLVWLKRGPRQTGFKNFDPTDTQVEGQTAEHHPGLSADDLNRREGCQRAGSAARGG